jgi:uncharacterized membrane protein
VAAAGFGPSREHVSPRASKDVLGLAALFAVSGTLHLVHPRPFEQIVPHQLPAKRALVYASGLVELACAAGLMAAPTRRVAGLVSAGLLVAVFPANVQMAVDVWAGPSALAKTIALVRLPMQVPLVRSAWRAWKT